MAGFLVAVAQAIQGLQCQLLDGNEAFVNSIGRFAGPVRSRALDGINATRRLLGCDPNDDPEEPPPPFTGGQCPSRYRVTFTGTGPTAVQGGVNCVGTTARNGFGDLWGPIGALQVVEEVCSGEFGAGSRKGVSCFGFTATARRTTPIVILLGGISYPDFSIASVVPLSGDPDDCDDLPPDYGPPAPRPINIDITFQPDFGPEITVPITFNFQPVEINLNGTFRIPFNFDFGGFEFSGNVNFNPTANVTINPPRANPGDGQGTEGQGEDEPGETIPPAPPEQKIIGVVVTATDVDSTRVSQIFNPGMTPTFAPRLGSVKFAYSLGGATFFSSDIDIKDRRTFIECPFSQGADAAIASAQPGIQLSFTEIRGYALATVDDVQSNTPEP